MVPSCPYQLVAVEATTIERAALIFVGPALAAKDFADSALYSADYVRRFRGGDGPRGPQ